MNRSCNSILCRFGIHTADPYVHIQVKRKADLLGIDCDLTQYPCPPYKAVVVDRETVPSDIKLAAEVARAIFTHRNTVLYHLNKVKQQTGLDPRWFYDLVELVKIAQEVLENGS